MSEKTESQTVTRINNWVLRLGRVNHLVTVYSRDPETIRNRNIFFLVGCNDNDLILQNLKIRKT